MSPLSLLVCLAGAIDLGSWDFQPWERVAQPNNPVGSPLVATHRIRGILESRNLSGTLLDRDTLQFWTDERGICRSARWWRYTDTTTQEAVDFYGIKAGSDALPPDSGRTSRTVAGRLRETGRLSSQHSGRRSIWIYSREPAPEIVHFDWDTTIVDRDASGRMVSKREVWTDFAWSSDSVVWAEDGSPARWITRDGGSWTDLMEVHDLRWSGGRLVQDDVLSVTENGPTSDTTAWRLSCSWLEDSLLRGCTTTLLHSNATRRSYRRRFDSLVVVRDENGRARRLESMTEGKWTGRTLWDSQGRRLSWRELDGDEFHTRVSFDSSRYDDLPWPSWTGYGYGSAATLLDQVPLEEITTFRWDLEPNTARVSRPTVRNRIHLVQRDSRLHLEAPDTPSGFLSLLDPAGRERARAPLHEGSASVVVPLLGGVWIWRLTDSQDRESARGRIAIP